MPGAVAVSLRGGRESQAREMFTLRLPMSLRAYVEDAAKTPGRNMTEVICSAVALDRDLAKSLENEKRRIQEFAEENGLSMRDDLAEVLATLIQRGLNADSKRKP